LAAHILGISGVDNTGLEGIDNYYNELVGGTKGQIVIEHDAVGREIPEAMHSYVAPVDGANLVLTIDETIQYVAERQAEDIFNNFKCKHVTIIVMDPNNGEILALASRPTFDPNDYGEYPDDARRNYAINDAYEPGSTMKITTLAMALEDKTTFLDATYDCPGYIKVGSATIHCSQNRAHGHQTLTQVFDNSCNVGFVQLGLKLGLERYFYYLTTFGFGQKTGIDIPGESTGIVVNQAAAKQIDLATMSMGQANAVTPLQLLTAVSGIVNGGTKVQPHLVLRVVDKEGEVLQAYQQPEPVRIISEATSLTMRQIMESEVTNGTGQNAAIEGYRVGGKTGTAQKIDPNGKGYLENEFVASFLGVAPIDDPKLAVLVVADAPQGYPYYGGWVCAPAAREVMRDTLQYWGEPLNTTLAGGPSAVADATLLVPDVVNLSAGEAEALLKSRGFTVKTDGSGDMVYQQVPRAGSRANKASQVLISLNPSEAERHSGSITVPDLYGKSIREVGSILSSLGLYLQPEGSGLAYEQVPEAGQTVSSGSSIKVLFQALSDE
jgi:stage V sporulation protein D (sporulation-specific penicillin-binding protein)